jgi:hypothetical protein
MISKMILVSLIFFCGAVWSKAPELFHDKTVMIILHQPAACFKVMKLVKGSGFFAECHRAALPRSRGGPVRGSDLEPSRIYRLKYLGSAFAKDFQRLKKIREFAVTEIES